jgi:hypothetical protein
MVHASLRATLRLHSCNKHLHLPACATHARHAAINSSRLVHCRRCNTAVISASCPQLKLRFMFAAVVTIHELVHLLYDPVENRPPDFVIAALRPTEKVAQEWESAWHVHASSSSLPRSFERQCSRCCGPGRRGCTPSAQLCWAQFCNHHSHEERDALQPERQWLVLATTKTTRPTSSTHTRRAVPGSSSMREDNNVNEMGACAALLPLKQAATPRGMGVACCRLRNISASTSCGHPALSPHHCFAAAAITSSSPPLPAPTNLQRLYPSEDGGEAASLCSLPACKNGGTQTRTAQEVVQASSARMCGRTCPCVSAACNLWPFLGTPATLLAHTRARTQQRKTLAVSGDSSRARSREETLIGRCPQRRSKAA